jgi:hypothetical protein
MSSQRREVTEGQSNERKFSNMKNRNIQLTAILFVVALALTSIVQAGPRPDGGFVYLPANAPQASPQLRYIVIDLGPRVANAISESGRIVGTTLFGGEIHAAYWNNSRSPAIDLGTLPGFTQSFAADINPRREIVGAAGIFPALRPVFWASSQSAPVELPGVPVGLSGIASHINPRGQIVGWFRSEDFFSVQRAVFWPNSNAAPVYLA